MPKVGACESGKERGSRFGFWPDIFALTPSARLRLISRVKSSKTGEGIFHWPVVSTSVSRGGNYAFAALRERTWRGIKFEVEEFLSNLQKARYSISEVQRPCALLLFYAILLLLWYHVVIIVFCSECKNAWFIISVSFVFLLKEHKKSSWIVARLNRTIYLKTRII